MLIRPSQDHLTLIRPFEPVVNHTERCCVKCWGICLRRKWKQWQDCAQYTSEQGTIYWARISFASGLWLYTSIFCTLLYGFKSFAKPNKTSQQRRVSCILSVIYCTNIQANQEQSIVKQSSLRAEKLCEAINDFVDFRRNDTYFISHARTPSIYKKSKTHPSG